MRIVEIPVDVLERIERTQRKLARRIYRLEQALRSTHPETISTSNWTPVRASLLSYLVASEKTSRSLADAIAEVLNEHDHSRRDHPD